MRQAMLVEEEESAREKYSLELAQLEEEERIQKVYFILFSFI